MSQQFGGEWTEVKLKAIADYLRAYLKIFTANPKASRFTRHYVDAFAGCGLRQLPTLEPGLWSLEEGEAVRFMEGSVRKVLALDQPFHRYWFVEKNPAYADSLEIMIANDFAPRAPNCSVRRGDANEFLLQWIGTLGQLDRAVVFLDPYGMSVRWTTLERLGESGKVDLWLLFPSSSVIRMLPNAGPPDEAWSRRLSELFGTDSWLDEFYTVAKHDDLFGPTEETHREVTAERVAAYLMRRLGEVFHAVAPQPLVLYNSRHSPLYHLVFAAANPQGAKAAIPIARHIIGNA